MNTMIMWLESGEAWSPEQWAISHGGARSTLGQVTIERLSGWISVIPDQTLIEDYDDFERELLSGFFIHPISFLVEWRGNEMLEFFLREIPLESTAVLDNDHGLIVPARLVRELPIDSWIEAAEITRTVEDRSHEDRDEEDRGEDGDTHK